MSRAFLIIDVQNDFIPGGALPTRGGGEVVPVINALMPQFDLVVATQDWHPANHGSFASNHPGHKPGEVIELNGVQQVLWPDHCVQGSWGAELHRDLDRTRIDHVVQKGTDPAIDSYSAFFDNGRKKSTGLADYLRGKGVTALTIAGLATDYCVLWSVRDALSLGFTVRVARDGCRGVELHEGDIETAFAEMRSNGADVIAQSSQSPES